VLLAHTLLNRPGPLARLLLAHPNAPSPDPEGRAVDATVPVVVADNVAESFFAASTIIDREVELLNKPYATS